MKNILKHSTILLAIAILFLACSKDDSPPEKEEVVLTVIDEHTSINDANGVIYIENLPGSINNTYSSGHVPVFFDFNAHQIINPYDENDAILELSEEKKQSLDWDMAFTDIYNSYITINNGEIEDSPGFGGSAQGKLIVIDAIFDELDAAPSETDFDTFMEEQTDTGWEDFPPGDKGWFFYSLQSHIMSSISGVVIVIKTANGRFAKIEMGSLYLASPENPTVNTPTPYFNFRYYLQTDGSRNLNTNKN